MLRALLLFCSLYSGALAQDGLEAMRSDLASGNYALAAQFTGPALVRDMPGDPEAHYLYSYALYLVGSVVSAREALTQAFTLSPEPPPYYEVLNGLLLAAEGDSRGAQRALAEAFSRTQDYDTAMAWGRVAWQGGDYETALAAYSAAADTRQGRREVWSHLNRGRMLKTLDRPDEAITALQQAIAVFEANDPGGDLPNPGYVEAFFRLGEVYEALGDAQQAVAYYEAARGADPNYAPASVALERVQRDSP